MLAHTPEILERMFQEVASGWDIEGCRGVEETDQRVGNWFPYNMGRLCGLLVFAKIEISTQSVLPRLGSLEPTVDLPMLPLG